MKNLREALIKELDSVPGLESDNLVWFSLEYSRDTTTGRIYVSRKSAFSDKRTDEDTKELLLEEEDSMGC